MISSLSASYTTHLFRLSLLCLLIFLELMTISLNFDAITLHKNHQQTWFGFITYAGQFAKIIVVAATALLLAIWPRLSSHYAQLASPENSQFRPAMVLTQLALFFLFYQATALVFNPQASVALSSLLVAGWLFLLLLVPTFWLLSLAPLAYWTNFIRSEKQTILLSGVVGVAAWSSAQYSAELWGPLSELTFQFSHWMLSLIYPDVIVIPEKKVLGAYDFLVNIAPACSGYEGIGLVVIFISFYLSIFRADFRFPHALLLYPIGIVAIWVFNSVRIVALISIGASFSPDIAVGGFHSQAGWISFILTVVGILVLAHKSAFFCYKDKTKDIKTKTSVDALPVATLAPLVVLLSATLLTTSLSSGFDWLYPLRVFMVGVTLVYFWSTYSFANFRLNWQALFAGLAVFLIWLALVPDNAESSASFQASLSSMESKEVIFWMCFRVIGAVLTVPIAEELAFRAYLLCKISSQKVSLKGEIPFTWLGLLLTSILFGALHGAWIAGTLAGLVYGLLRYRNRNVWDAIVAHASTNLMLSIYIISTGHWSLW